MSQSRWAKLATYNSGFEVDLLCVALDAEAIPYLIRGLNRGMDGAGYQGLVVGGIDVLVPEDALEEARAVLANGMTPPGVANPPTDSWSVATSRTVSIGNRPA